MTRGLSRPQLSSCFAALIALFLLWNGPVWQHAWDVDASVVASYLPIPFMVLGLLLWSRRFTWTWLFLDTLALALFKFAATYVLATVFWATGDAPEKHAFEQPRYERPAPPATAPPPTPLDQATTGIIAGIVVDRAGEPVNGALVWIDRGLDGRVFAAPTEPVVLEASAAGIRPDLATAQTWQPIHLRSTDGTLHTIAGRDSSGERVFNRAAPADGSVAEVVLREGAGMIDVRCRLHKAGGAEPNGLIGVFAHPFHAITAADGAFRFEGVPAGALGIATTGAAANADVKAGDTATVELRVR